ncbi:MAG: 50S ribosomal protein L9 [Parcubacteria group bacterium CG1_02_37_51]|uniref:Large ribosomal subunit protein bL9 n=1 Tax=Candidatus Komeilibacteria bacterium CG_4_9_14_0_8_um_filter_36_9 TaxID=1974473 RepID=A0A2M8DQZ7_9BACT|nr:MAG: 50S ribosomal protein L9 [Parcubacteria group bacterium CG1_02_37_51]PJC01770.1 MAG: 50S ribosomal protein L9 [Candidatus Komeilibacteria bacterium CG_4_9_14_0_8_um_filter_36_9]
MKVIITKECQFGNIGDIKELKAGFAANFLIPQGLAVSATDKTIKEWQSKSKQQEKVIKKQVLAKDKLIEQLKNKSLTIVAKANDHDILYAAIHEAELQNAIEKQLHLDLTGYTLKLLDNVKQLGEHEIKLQINNIPINIKVNIKKGDDQN